MGKDEYAMAVLQARRIELGFTASDSGKKGVHGRSRRRKGRGDDSLHQMAIKKVE